MKSTRENIIKALLEFLLESSNEDSMNPYEKAILQLEEISEEVLREFKKKLSERSS